MTRGTRLASAHARGSHDHAADGIGVPYSTLRGWLQRRGVDAGDGGKAFTDAVTALRGHLDSAKQHLKALIGDVDAMGQRIDELEYLLGHETDARGQDDGDASPPSLGLSSP
jgi:hypothetical protein